MDVIQGRVVVWHKGPCREDPRFKVECCICTTEFEIGFKPTKHGSYVCGPQCELARDIRKTAERRNRLFEKVVQGRLSFRYPVVSREPKWAVKQSFGVRSKWHPRMESK